MRLAGNRPVTAAEGPGSGRRRPMSKRRRRIRAVRRGLMLAVQIGVIVTSVALAAAVWILIHAIDATGRLADIRTDIQRVRADLVAGRTAVYDMRAAQQDAEAAREDTHDFVWGAVSWVAPVETMRGITEAVSTLAQGALPQIVELGPSLRPSVLRVGPDKLALAPLIAAAPAMREAAAAAVIARSEVAHLPAGWFSPVTVARDKVLDELTSLAGSVDDLARFATAGPPMLGENGLRRYFVGIQNNAEARATGGLVAAYDIVTAYHGTIHVVAHGSDVDLEHYFAPRPLVALGPDYDHEYGNYHPAQRWITSNLSPHFPYAADIWAHLWEAQTGEHIDGSFGVDPVALADLLGAVGPVTVPGYDGVFSHDNLATYIESTEYDFPGLISPHRKEFLGRVGSAVVHKVLSGNATPAAIATELAMAAGGGHLQLWSSRPEEERQISGTPLAGELPATTAPFASVSVNNATGTKLDYYLHRTLSYQAGSCSGSTRASTVSITLDNEAPRSGLPDYVRYMISPKGVVSIERVPYSRLYVFIHVTSGATLLQATVDGKGTTVGSGIELGHPVYFLDVILPPDQPRTIVLHLTEPTAPGAATTLVQPMAVPQQTDLRVPECA